MSRTKKEDDGDHEAKAAPFEKISPPPPWHFQTRACMIYFWRDSPPRFIVFCILYTVMASACIKKSKETGSTPLRGNTICFFPVARAIRGSTSNYIFLPPPQARKTSYSRRILSLRGNLARSPHGTDRVRKTSGKRRESLEVYSSLQYSAHSISWWWCVQGPPPPPPPG